MSEDPRCCGSGMCIIDGEGRCWCGQQWDGQKMCAPQRTAPAASGPGGQPSEAESEAAPAADRSTVGRLLLLAALSLPLAALSPPAAQAQSLPTQPSAMQPAAGFTAREVQALQATVQGQLRALAAGDAGRAYAYASPAIQQQFGDAARFMAMVRTAYPMIIQPRSLAFRVPERVAAGVVQPVQLRDQAGRPWLATYQLEAQAGGGWRISGCIVTADDQRLSA